ncbi:MAG: dihydrofolate reductase [Burkholderiales bacterium]|nr:dihydrofolate reductase [Burkholderiales bacterium]
MHSVTAGRARPRLCLVAALASNGVIGARGGLPWRLPEDLKRFKALTLGHPIIMGRRTWESIGRALPGRRNIVVTRRRDFTAPGAEVAGSLEDALARCADADVVFVIGGAELYAAALPIADALEFTEIDAAFEGDTRFPAYARAAWREVRRERHRRADGLRFDFVRYERAALRSAAA